MKESVVGAETQGQETACLRARLGQGLCVVHPGCNLGADGRKASF